MDSHGCWARFGCHGYFCYFCGKYTIEHSNNRCQCALDEWISIWILPWWTIWQPRNVPYFLKLALAYYINCPPNSLYLTTYTFNRNGSFFPCRDPRGRIYDLFLCYKCHHDQTANTLPTLLLFPTCFDIVFLVPVVLPTWSKRSLDTKWLLTGCPRLTEVCRSGWITSVYCSKIGTNGHTDKRTSTRPPLFRERYLDCLLKATQPSQGA